MTDRKSLDKVPKVNQAQISFGKGLGLDLSGATVGVAWSMIEDKTRREFWAVQDLGTPTSKQIELAAKFGYGISSLTRGVADAVIDDIMLQLNLESISNQGLAPGVLVRHKSGEWRCPIAISSITEDGTVYLKGGQGHRAWARSLVRARESPTVNSTRTPRKRGAG